jgi:hypothetical protein
MNLPRIRQAGSDALECFLLPALAIVLPWPLCFSFFVWVSKHEWIFNSATTMAAKAARGRIPAADTPAWSARFRLIQLVDRADFYLSRFRSNRWLGRHMHVHGDQWPRSPFMGVTFHFGAGLWAIRHLCQGEARASFLSARFGRATFSGRALLYLYALLRNQEVVRAGKAPVIFTGGSTGRIREAWRSGASVLGLIDVPARQTHEVLPVQFRGRTAWFPSGLLRIALAEGVPVVLFTARVSRRGGRELRIKRLDTLLIDDLLQQVVSALEEEINADSAAWHRWADMDLFDESQ